MKKQYVFEVRSNTIGASTRRPWSAEPEPRGQRCRGRFNYRNREAQRHSSAHEGH